jgi:peptidoglycan/LPS O-acetylase OafA/YrhL
MLEISHQEKNQNLHSSYRSDIDGLRAVAILPVVFYHAELGPFGGGFAGVNVFFVISGFLITQSILERREKGGFSIGWFYERRARRLLPPLFFTIFLTLLASLLLLSPEDLSDASLSALSALLFTSNIFFHWKIDYFQQDADLMPFLHTWSLAVEEQFYIFWPFLIIMVSSCFASKKNLRLLQVTIFLAVLSFSASIFAVHTIPNAAFYMLPFRLWEISAGAIVYLLFMMGYRPSSTINSLLSTLGLGLILGTIFTLSSDSRFPGANALPVILGTALLLVSGKNTNGFILRFLSARPIVYIGKISYSLYLLHWPIFSLFRNYQANTEISDTDASLLILLSFLLASFCYHFIETPFRKQASVKGVIQFSIGAGTSLAIVTSGMVALDGLPARAGNLPEYAASREVMWDWPCDTVLPEVTEAHCVFGADWNNATDKLVLWGDSHADHFAPLVRHAIADQKVAVLLYRRCPPFLDDVNVRRWHRGSDRFSVECGEAHAEFLEWLSQNVNEINAILMAAAWSGYPPSLYQIDPAERDLGMGAQLLGKGLKATLAQIPSTIPVRILSDVPRPRRVLLQCLLEDSWIVRDSALKCDALPKDGVVSWHRATTETLLKTAAGHPNTLTFDMVERICDLDTCPIFLKGRLLYRDRNHIRRNLTKVELEEMTVRTGLRQIIGEVIASD